MDPSHDIPPPGHVSLVVFTRNPRAGRAKTRLIPALGVEGAAEFQRRMTLHTVGRAWAFCRPRRDTRLIIAFDGDDEHAMRGWLGPLNCVPQDEGDLGERLRRSVAREFDGGARSVIVIGADCPRLSEASLNAAMDALENAPLVFGPATDGGYYLVALRQPAPHVFANISWGGSRVLAESIGRARELGIEPILLSSLPDADLPEDLPDARAALDAGRRVSVIIPAVDEERNLARLLPALVAARPHEILIADGGSTDGTAALAAAHGARVVTSPRGRARQMNETAAQASGEHLLFLHADTIPPDRFPEIIADHLGQPGVAGGAFKFALDESFPGKALIERLVALRCTARHLPYGDQGLFVRRSLFSAIGGFPDWPILEDLEFVRRLRRLGRIVITPEPAVTSARRWKRSGVIRTFLRHQLILLGYHIGRSPASLAAMRK